MAFRFGLQQILDYRQGLEDQGREELVKRKRILDEAAHKLEILKNEQDKTMNLWREHSGGEMDIFYLNNTYNYMQRISGNISTQIEEKKKCYIKVDEQRNAVKKCWQDRRVMEILKDKSHGEYIVEEKKHENRTNDDLSLKSFIRKQRQNTGII